MISKKEFISVIKDIEKCHKEVDRLESAVPGLGFALLDLAPIDTLISTLESAMDMEHEDKYGTVISWWIYEMDYGKDRAEITITDKDGEKTFLLDTVDKLYDYLVKYESRTKENRTN